MMRAKFQVSKITEHKTTNTTGEYKYAESIEFFPVTSKPFDKDGNNEDNTFARWTPGGTLRLEITNPNLWGQFKEGDKFYADFSKAEA